MSVASRAMAIRVSLIVPICVCACTWITRSACPADNSCLASDREIEEVVVSAVDDPVNLQAAFSRFIGQPTDRIHLYRYDPSAPDQFTAIPFQIDRVSVITLNSNCPTAIDFSCAAVKPPAHQTYPTNCEKTYAFDSNGNPAAGNLGDGDEIVFLQRDAGPQAPNTVVWKSGNNSNTRYEIAVNEKDSSGVITGQKWVYAFLFLEPHAFELPNPYYVKWTANSNPDADRPLDVCVTQDTNHDRGLKACGLFEKGPQFDSVLASHATYRQRYTGHWIFSRLWNVAPGASSPRPEMIDRVKWRAQSETEVTWSNCACPVFLGLKVGPVRMIRLVQGAASGITTTRTDWLYASHARQRVRLRVHPIGGIEHFFDFLSSESGSKLFTQSKGTDVSADVINGSGIDSGFSATLQDWTQVNSPNGRFTYFFKETRPLNEANEGYDYDDSSASRRPEFQDGAYGNFGEIWPDTSPNTVDRVCSTDPSDPLLFYAQVDSSLFAVDTSDADDACLAARLADCISRSLTYGATDQTRAYSTQPPPTPICSVTLNSANPSNGRYLDLAPTTGSCSDSTTAFVVRRAIGMGSFAYAGEVATGGTFRDFGVFRGITYRYQVRSRNRVGVEGPSSSIVTMAASDTTPPAIPSNVAISAGSHSVTVSWDPSPDRDISGFNVYLATTAGGPYTKANVSLIPAMTFSRTVSALVPGTPYYAVMRAQDMAGNESANSQEVWSIPAP